MSGEVVIDEFHLTFVATTPLTEDEVKAIHRILSRSSFRNRLRHAVQRIADRRPSLRKLVIRVSQ